MAARPDPDLIAAWYDRARVSGFDDIELPPRRRPGVPESRHRAAFSDYLRPEDPSHRAIMVGLDVLLACEDNRSTVGLRSSDISLWDHGTSTDYEVRIRQDDLLAFAGRALWGKDREIAVAIAHGARPYEKRLKRILHVGQHRIERVVRQIISGVAAA